MRNIKLVIQYEGTRYQGWQRLSDSQNTIQEKIETVLSTLLKEEVKLAGSGRTDAGVHAQMQVANFLTRSHVSCSDITRHCYAYLPHDIVVKEAEEVAESFHSRFMAREKTYRYTIDNSLRHDVFARRYSHHVPQSLDLEAMKKAAALFVGEHDFRSFTKLHSKTKSTVRTIFAILIETQTPFITIRITGNGFLYKMVRLLAGALIAAGLHHIDPTGLKAILDKRDKNNPVEPAPPQGLCLEAVRY